MGKILDIRTKEERVTSIQFCDNYLTNLILEDNSVHVNIKLETKEVTENLILALQKTIELGWVK